MLSLVALPIIDGLLRIEPLKVAYVIERSAIPVSFHPLDVDAMQNSLLVKALVSTLLTTDESHRRAPYLANKWENSSDFKRWTFSLVEGLACEDGTRIDASTFLKSFQWILKIHGQKNPAVPSFSQLVGWNDFLEGRVSDIDGLKVVDDYTVEFNFSKPMDVGFLAFLSIPQFGFYCPSNFDESGNWNQDREFVSSGPYTLAALSSSGLEAHLAIRLDWSLNSSNMPKSVKFAQVQQYEPNSDETGIILNNSGELASAPEGFIRRQGALVQLRSIVLSPYRNNLFSDLHNRRVFAQRLSDWLRTNPPPSDLLSFAETMWPYNNSVEINEPATYRLGDYPKELSLIHTPLYSSPLGKYYLKGIEAALSGTGIKLIVEELDRGDSNAIMRYLSNRHYDLRLVASVIGGGINSWIVDMMFCSDIGVCFPDASGRICQLVRENEQSPLSENEFARRFNVVLKEDAVVIPLHHTGGSISVGPGVSLEAMSSVTSEPNIEQLRVK